MFVPIPALVAIAVVIAFLLFLLMRRGSRDMLDEQRREAGVSSPRPSLTRQPSTNRLTRHDIDHILDEPDIAAALAAGHKIKAIKLVRERTGLGLKESKDLVESI